MVLVGGPRRWRAVTGETRDVRNWLNACRKIFAEIPGQLSFCVLGPRSEVAVQAVIKGFSEDEVMAEFSKLLGPAKKLDDLPFDDMGALAAGSHAGVSRR